MAKDKKILIAGTGRAGTTLLMQILTELGYDTGFTDKYQDWRITVRAGMEMGYPVKAPLTDEFDVELETHIGEAKNKINALPKIVKSPSFSLHLGELLKKGVIEVEHVIIPIREVSKAATSRVNVNLPLLPEPHLYFLNEKDRITRQKVFLYFILGHLIEALVLNDINYTFVKYPDMVYNSQYCYNQLKRVFKDLDKREFMKAHIRISNKDLITVQ